MTLDQAVAALSLSLDLAAAAAVGAFLVVLGAMRAARWLKSRAMRRPLAQTAL